MHIPMISVILSVFIFMLGGCSPVTSPIKNYYTLSAYGTKKVGSTSLAKSLLISPPEAVAACQGSQMLYINKLFERASFAHNAWANTPAEMLFPLIVKSMQRLEQFQVLTSTSNSEPTDYRLDTQILSLEQNFLRTPSQIDFAVKIVLSNVKNNQPLISKIMEYHVNCPTDTPYGGVLAANKAVELFTSDLSRFVSGHVH